MFTLFEIGFCLTRQTKIIKKNLRPKVPGALEKFEHSREFSETQTTPKVTKSKTSPPIRHNRLLERNMENASHDFKPVDNLAGHVLVRGGNKPGIHLFFEGLPVQVDEANLATIELSELQLEISQTYHEFLKTRIV